MAHGRTLWVGVWSLWPTKEVTKANAAPTMEKNATTEPIPIPALAPTLSSLEDCVLIGAEETVGVTEIEGLVEVLEG
ncbi:hypothetical protein BTUL_0258g00020 [Botrytis tulipae]|uniref:Uncharacterized protein n=1 Tax=Botrytis tulipae TaxID=87230 RepID=A0A4Z1E676_9HELO|nr:hypothetical protein BTUL_0258g00020 [Botrytis tulipae]